MKNILSIFALFIAFSFLGVTKANAETYLVNLSGSQGCGQYCNQLNEYLATQNTNSNSNSTSTSNTNNNGGQQTQSNPTTYPYQSYVNFPSTDAYYKTARNNGGQATSSNGYNYVQYPYPMYNYFQNPNPYPSQNMTGGAYQSYPTPMYTYYGGKKMTTNYAQNYSQPKTTTSNQNSGFILTSVR
jgi:hypothetical protein